MARVLVGLLPFFTACEDVESCRYRCTTEENRCPDQLTCDVTLGYCVSEGYVGTCDAETHEVTVCKGEPVELTVPGSVSSLNEAEGLPDSADFEDGRINATFGKSTVFAFGGPDETRQYWRVETTDDCPVVDTELTPLCVGETISQTLATHGGEGELKFELLEEDATFSLSPDGILSGDATLAGDHELMVSVTDERGLQTVRAVTVAVSNECPDVTDALPKSCADAEYEAPLVLEGPEVSVSDFTPTQRDGKGLSAKEAEDLVEQLAIKLVQSDDRYLVTAAPPRETLGEYLFSLKLKNDVRVEQRDISFGVKECEAVQADFTVCEDETFDLDLAGSTGDVWEFYDSANPLKADVDFVAERRLRGVMATPSPRYDIKARVKNATENTERVVTLTLAVLSHLENACNAPDASTSDEGTSSSTVGETSTATPSSESDASVPAFEEESLGEACVARSYEFSVPLDGISSGTWSATGLPSGLTIDEDTGIISGTPSAPFDGLVEVSGVRGGGSVSKAFHLAVHEWCSVVFKGVPDGSAQTHLYQVDRRSNVNKVDLSTDLSETEDVVNFSLSPSQVHVAFSVYDEYTRTTRVVVKRRMPLGSGQTETLIVGNITADPFAGLVTELKWGTDTRLSLLLETVSLPDAGPSLSPVGQKLFVYDVTKQGQATTATKALEATVKAARDLVWMGTTPCVTLAKSPGENAHATTCWNYGASPTAGESMTSHAIYNFFDGFQVRGHAGRFLQAQPAGVGSTMRLYSWMPNPPVGEDLPYSIHFATFASPRGDLVGKVRTEDDTEGSKSMEIDRASDPTDETWEEGGSANLYEPLGIIPDCTSIDAWRGGGALACSTGTSIPSDTVTIAIPTGSSLTTRPTFTATGHSTSGRRIFIDDVYYVYDDLDGHLRYVDVGANPPQALSQTHGEGRNPVALEPLGDGHFVMQGPTKMWLGAISGGTMDLIEVNDADTPAAFTECASAFAWNAFETWCGGDEISRRFQVAPDRDLGVFQTEDSNLQLFSISLANQLKRVQDVRVTCGDHPYCLTEFEVAR